MIIIDEFVRYINSIISYINSNKTNLKLDNYSNIQVLNEKGANSIIYVGTHKLTNRKDIIKKYVPNKKNGNKRVSEEQFINEIRKIALLNDPRFVTIYDAYYRNGSYICTMEYVKGITLKEWCRDKKNEVPKISPLKIRNCGNNIVIKRI